MQSVFRLIPTALFLTAVYVEAVAQEPAFHAVLNDSVVVTATRTASDIRLTGRRVVVWSATDIRHMPVSSVDELLRMASGVEVQSRGGFGVQSDLTIRGSTFNGVLVLIDGARLNDPMTGHFLADLPITLADIARIEVLRGPASALYGPDALGGVVHIMTYGGLAAQTSEQVPDVSGATLQYGSYGTTGVAGNAVRHRGRVGFGLSGHWMRSDGMPVRRDDGSEIVSTNGTVRTDFDRHTYSAFGIVDAGGQRVFMRAGFDTRDFGAFQFYTPFPGDTAREATSTYWVQTSTSRSSGKSAWRAHIAAKQHDDEYVYNALTPANRHTSRLLSGEWQVWHQPGQRVSLTAGVAAELRSIESNNLGDHADQSAGVFSVGVLQLSEDLTLTGGLRLNYDPAYGLEPTPQLSAAFGADAATFRLSAGRAVRAPNYVERYINSMRARPAGGNLGNPSLQPERAWSAEAGADFFPGANFALHVTGFARRTADLIDFALLSPADTVFLARNILTVNTRGLEVEANARHYHRNGTILLQWSYAYLDSDIGDVEPGVQFKYALTHARHQAQVTAAATFRGSGMSLQSIYREPLQAAGYGTVNLRGTQRLSRGHLPVLITAELRNVFDVRRSEIFGAPLPRRWVLVGMRLGR